MRLPELYLLCFLVGVLWSAATLLLGGLHFGHGHGIHFHGLSKGAKFPGHSHQGVSGHLAAMVNPSSAAVFLAWFGGVGFLLTRHSGFAFWLNLAVAGLAGLIGAWVLASFLHFLQKGDLPLNPSDYDLTGVLARVSSRIRAAGVGELIYVRDGARRSIPARSEDGTEIERGQEVIVTGYEKGIATVRTWEAMTREAGNHSGIR